MGVASTPAVAWTRIRFGIRSGKISHRHTPQTSDLTPVHQKSKPKQNAPWVRPGLALTPRIETPPSHRTLIIKYTGVGRSATRLAKSTAPEPTRYHLQRQHQSAPCSATVLITANSERLQHIAMCNYIYVRLFSPYFDSSAHHLTKYLEEA